jgi:hypothetical protein
MGEGKTAADVARELLAPETHSMALGYFGTAAKPEQKRIFARLLSAIPSRSERATPEVEERNRLLREALAANLPLFRSMLAELLADIGYEISHLGAYQDSVFTRYPWNLPGHRSDHELPHATRSRLKNLYLALDELVQSLSTAERGRLDPELWNYAKSL